MSYPPAVVVMGVCGSGKSTIGRALAESCGGVFHDADDFHPLVNIEKMKRGAPLDDADRAPWLERLATLLTDSASTDSPVFLACSALKASYRDILSSGCDGLKFVHLSGTPEVIRSRLRARSGHFMPETLIDSQFTALEVPTGALAVDIDQSVDAILATIVFWLESPLANA